MRMFRCGKRRDGGGWEERVRVVDEGKVVEVEVEGGGLDEDVCGGMEGRVSRGGSIKRGSTDAR
ncbi:hypothetical protein, partial [Bacillus velezensis]|uniref:hypothetical protein n=1 Tax=Bacillus velezensis TaxID=492670 RepID=UPI001C92E290